MPADTMVGVMFVLAVFGFFMVMLAYADFTENRRMSGASVRHGHAWPRHQAVAVIRPSL